MTLKAEFKFMVVKLLVSPLLAPNYEAMQAHLSNMCFPKSWQRLIMPLTNTDRELLLKNCHLQVQVFHLQILIKCSSRRNTDISFHYFSPVPKSSSTLAPRMLALNYFSYIWWASLVLPDTQSDAQGVKRLVNANLRLMMRSDLYTTVEFWEVLSIYG